MELLGKRDCDRDWQWRLCNPRGKLPSTCYFGTARHGQAGEIEGCSKKENGVLHIPTTFPHLILSREEGSAGRDRRCLTLTLRVIDEWSMTCHRSLLETSRGSSIHTLPTYLPTYLSTKPCQPVNVPHVCHSHVDDGWLFGQAQSRVEISKGPTACQLRIRKDVTREVDRSS